MQLADLEKAKKARESMSPEEREAWKRKNVELAKAAISGVGNKISKGDVEARAQPRLLTRQRVAAPPRG